MIVDCHTHVSFPADDAETAEHLEICSDLDACIVLPVSKKPKEKTNLLLSQYIAKNEKMHGFAVINPIKENVSLEHIKSVTVDINLEGIVLYCGNSAFHPAHSRAMLVYQAAQKLNLPVFFNNGATFSRDAVLEYCQPYQIDEIARKFQNLKIIIGNMGIPFFSQTLCMISKHPNVFADLTISPRKVWEIYNIVVSAHEAGVMDKLVFGSGFPFNKPGPCIETLLGFNRLLPDHVQRTVPREKIRNIIERNTLKLLGIESE